MEANLSRSEYQCFKEVYAAELNREETGETVVADVLPDISRILDATGMAYIRSKELEPGRLTVSASLSASVLYAPEEGGGVRCVPVTVPFSVTAEDEALDESCPCTARVRILSLEARALNPRKILVRAELAFDLRCYRREALSLCQGMGEDGGGADVHLLTETARLVSPVSVREKTFVITDEYRFSGSVPFTAILSQRAQVFSDDIKIVGNKLIFKGTAAVSLLCAGEDMECAPVEFTSVFSQILEIDPMEDGGSAELILACTGAYFELIKNGEGGLSATVELHMVAQAVAYEARELPYIADAYSNGHALEVARERLEGLCSRRQSATLLDTVKALCPVSEPVGEILWVTARPGAVSVEGDQVTAEVHACVCCRSGGALCSVSKRAQMQGSFDPGENGRAQVSAIRLSDVYASVTPEGIELRLPVELSLTVTDRTALESVSTLELGEELPREEVPSIYLLHTGAAPKLWPLAKKYRSSVERILSANGAERESDLAKGVLLIPTER